MPRVARRDYPRASLAWYALSNMETVKILSREEFVRRIQCCENCGFYRKREVRTMSLDGRETVDSIG